MNRICLLFYEGSDLILRNFYKPTSIRLNPLCPLIRVASLCGLGSDSVYLQEGRVFSSRAGGLDFPFNGLNLNAAVVLEEYY